MSRSGRLSKSLYTSGLQCLRLLYWKVRERDTSELALTPKQKAIFAQGHRVGALARTYVPGGTLIDVPAREYRRRIDETQAAIRSGAPVVYEASFSEDGVFVSADILERTGTAWVLTEVKSSSHVKPEHYDDAAVQTYVVRRAGLDVARTEVMHLDRRCTHPNLSDLFVRADVTRPVQDRLPAVPAEIGRQIAALDEQEPPAVSVGDHCKVPRECPFWKRCHTEVPVGHVSELYEAKTVKADLLSQGYELLADIPISFDLKPLHARQRRAAMAGTTVLEPTLAAALSSIGRPTGYLDFETVMPAIPVWPGCHPFDQIPVQFTYAVERQDGTADTSDFLAERGVDPREPLAEALIAAATGAGPILAYSAGFERQRIEGLAAAVPRLRSQLSAIGGRLVDLLEIVQGNVYDLAFRGSFSLKKVLPALVPEMSYAGLAIADGEIASIELEKMLLGDEAMSRDEEERTRAALLAYCRVDVLGMVKLVAKLRELAAQTAP